MFHVEHFKCNPCGGWCLAIFPRSNFMTQKNSISDFFRRCRFLFRESFPLEVPPEFGVYKDSVTAFRVAYDPDAGVFFICTAFLDADAALGGGGLFLCRAFYGTRVIVPGYFAVIVGVRRLIVRAMPAPAIPPNRSIAGQFFPSCRCSSVAFFLILHLRPQVSSVL